MEGLNQTLPVDVLATQVALPSWVVDTIAPAVDAVRDEARQGTRLGEHRRLTVATGRFLRQYTDPGYQQGIAVILAAALPGVDLGTRGRPDLRDRDCRCNECEDLSCDGSCDRCEDGDCPQCGCSSAQSCCGWCSDCESHHSDGDSAEDRVIVVRSGRCHHVYCTDCEHVCDDY